MKGVRLVRRASPHQTMRSVSLWYAKSQVDYADHFLKLYIAYNAWYREVTGVTNDRQALIYLKKRFILWEDYSAGKAMVVMKLYMERLVDLTHKEPLASRYPLWNGEIEGVYDWLSLIEYWYQVRCLIVHGAAIKQKYVWLAYETLDVFMSEIIDRIKRYQLPLEQVDMKRVETLTEPLY